MVVVDLRQPGMTERHIAVNVVLQLHAGIDPDTAKDLADRILHAADRASVRGLSAGGPTPDEVRRAQNALARKGYPVTSEEAYYVLGCALRAGWGS